MRLSLEDTTGSLAAFASAGLIGSDAGTSLRAMLLRLATPAVRPAT
jgi:TP901 family phage tail tape measure protein